MWPFQQGIKGIPVFFWPYLSQEVNIWFKIVAHAWLGSLCGVEARVYFLRPLTHTASSSWTCSSVARFSFNIVSYGSVFFNYTWVVGCAIRLVVCSCNVFLWSPLMDTNLAKGHFFLLPKDCRFTRVSSFNSALQREVRRLLNYLSVAFS